MVILASKMINRASQWPPKARRETENQGVGRFFLYLCNKLSTSTLTLKKRKERKDKRSFFVLCNPHFSLKIAGLSDLIVIKIH